MNIEQMMAIAARVWENEHWLNRINHSKQTNTVIPTEKIKGISYDVLIIDDPYAFIDIEAEVVKPLQLTDAPLLSNNGKNKN